MMESVGESAKQKHFRGRLPNGQANPVDLHVGIRIRQRRLMVGLSLDELSKSLGLTYQQLQKYEIGANRISASRLYVIAGALGVHVDYFFMEMADEIKALSPGVIAQKNAQIVFDGLSFDPIAKRESLELIRAFCRIKSSALRNEVIKLALLIGQQHQEGDALTKPGRA